MTEEAKNLNWEEREKIFAILLLKLQEDLGVKLRVKLQLSPENKIISQIEIFANQNE